jgi:hypothetical protein
MDGCRYVSLELTDAGKEGIIVFAARFYLKDSFDPSPRLLISFQTHLL